MSRRSIVPQRHIEFNLIAALLNCLYTPPASQADWYNFGPMYHAMVVYTNDLVKGEFGPR